MQDSCALRRANHKQGFAQLVQELSEAFKDRNWILSATASVKPEIVDNNYDIPKLMKYLDWVSLLTFDYAGENGRTGHNAPLVASDKLNVDYSVNYWLKKGAPSKKLILGIAGFGKTFNLTNPQSHDLNAPVEGPGLGGNYTKAAGTIAFYEICAKTKRNKWRVVRDPQNIMSPYTYYENQWISYDDVENIRIKAKYVRAMRLGGAMFWSLDFDDFTALCGCGYYPLLTALHQELRSIGGRPIHNCT